MDPFKQPKCVVLNYLLEELMAALEFTDKPKGEHLLELRRLEFSRMRIWKRESS